MSRTLINPEGLRKNPNLSQVAMAKGTIVCFAGMLAADENGDAVGGDLREQVIFCMRKLEKAMTAAGVGWEHIVRRTVYTTQPQEVAAIGAAVREVTGDVGQPAQSVVGVTLARPDFLVEIECTAVID